MPKTINSHYSVVMNIYIYIYFLCPFKLPCLGGVQLPRSITGGLRLGIFWVSPHWHYPVHSHQCLGKLFRSWQKTDVGILKEEPPIENDKYIDRGSHPDNFFVWLWIYDNSLIFCNSPSSRHAILWKTRTAGFLRCLVLVLTHTATLGFWMIEGPFSVIDPPVMVISFAFCVEYKWQSKEHWKMIMHKQKTVLFDFNDIIWRIKSYTSGVRMFSWWLFSGP